MNNERKILEFSRFLLKHRNSKLYTQAQLAAITGIHSTLISHFEREGESLQGMSHHCKEKLLLSNAPKKKLQNAENYRNEALSEEKEVVTPTRKG